LSGALKVTTSLVIKAVLE